MRIARHRGAAALAALLFVLTLAGPAHAGLISQEQEIAIGRQAARQIESRYRVVTDMATVERINRVGGALLDVRERDLPYRFQVLDVPDINAMALPGGFVYATRGLMEAMPDPELSFVLAHELQHIERKHSVQAIERDLYTQIGLSAVISIFSRGEVSEGTANTIQIANMVLSNQYSQAQEREADREGMQMMARAGVDPMGAVAALETLQRQGGTRMPGFLNWFLGSHPLTTERISAARQLAQEIAFRPAEVASTGELAIETVQETVAVANLPPVDPAREADLIAALDASRYRLAAHPLLMHDARLLLANPPSASSVGPDRAVIAWTFTPGATEAQVRSQVLDREIPRTIGNRQYASYGLAVGITPEGKRRLILLLN